MATTQTSADVVIVGAGIVGSLMAEKIAQQGLSVLILESGPNIDRNHVVAKFRHGVDKGDYMAPYPYNDWAPEPRKFNDYFQNEGPVPYSASYIRGVGGTTWHWAGMAWRYVPNDFKLKTLYGVGRDWPFSYDDLEPFYYEAEVKMGVSGPEDNGSPRSKPFPMPELAPSWALSRVRDRLEGIGYKVIGNTAARNSQNYDGRPACVGNNNCMPVCPVDAQYHGGISAQSAKQAGVNIITEAIVYKIEHAKNSDKIEAIHYYTPNKDSFRVTGKTFVLAANAIETPKLMLMSKSDRFPNGIGNSNDMVGRHLCDHPRAKVSFEVDEPIWPGRGPMSEYSIQSERDGEWRSESAAFRIDFSNTNPVRGITDKLIKQGVYGEELEQQIRHKSAHSMGMKNIVEQLPDPNNRVMLGDRLDTLGIPNPKFYYSVSDYTRRGNARAREIFTTIAKRLGAKELSFSAEDKFSLANHITGTLGMGDDRATTVCNGEGRSHFHDNLFLAGTGVLPTVATVNSTLTAVAVGLRTAEFIIEDLV
ncbi:GMC family oxidoreductase [Marinomonas ostreistagni]|uniref:GMC family oxidoreductase n=1 Tax=Marinomonas ostreistagni TaxID=359209 RepID=UPI0019528881|nr:GMC family oxidoreductase [Marinomonas ostreistagni]MBM6551844.1 GMC family oxidoreductase [Marinomonas ostreistagni]